MQILGLGHPRTGTGYHSALLRSFGLDVLHEVRGKDGIVAWQLAANDKNDNYVYILPRDVPVVNPEVILYNVRDPFQSIPSIVFTEDIHQPSLAFRERHGVVKSANIVETAIRSLAQWDKLIEDRKFDLRWRVEDESLVVRDHLASMGFIIRGNGTLPSQDTNGRQHPSWNDPRIAAEFRAVSLDDLATLDKLCEKWGYESCVRRVKVLLSKREREKALLSHYAKNIEYYSFASCRAEIEGLMNRFEKVLIGARVLDLGCGTGGLTESLHGHASYIGIDYCPERIERAKKVHPGNEFRVEDVYGFLEGTDETFDIIFAFEVLEHLEDPELVISLAKKRLACGGCIVGSVPINEPYVAHLSVFKTREEVEKRLCPDVVFEKERHFFCLWM